MATLALALHLHCTQSRERGQARRAGQAGRPCSASDNLFPVWRAVFLSAVCEILEILTVGIHCEKLPIAEGI
jgi:hypothetical protein